MCHISVITPAFKCAACIPELHRRLSNVLSEISDSYEIIFVDDGSPGNDWETIAEICGTDPKVRGVKLSRNFGQHHAISAGLSKAEGEWVVVMDCDLQDPPEEVARMLALACEGYDIVLARRFRRKDSWLKRVTSDAFYRFLGWLTGTSQDPAVANFGVYHRKVVNAINSLPEQMRFFPTMVRWVGFRSIKLDINHNVREMGGTSYSFLKRLSLAADICLAHSDKPLRMVVSTGFVVSGVGFAFAAYMLTQAIRGKIEVIGYASLIVSLWILAGLIILIIGVVGLYVGKIFEGVKNRPTFLIDQVLEGDRSRQ
jgi:glycosyltransferase involved in cell wall biosynthesis